MGSAVATVAVLFFVVDAVAVVATALVAAVVAVVLDVFVFAASKKIYPYFLKQTKCAILVAWIITHD